MSETSHLLTFHGQLIRVPPLAQAIIRKLTNSEDTAYACEKFVAICKEHYLDPQKVIDSMRSNWTLD